MNDAMAFLRSRMSIPARQLGLPGPDPDTLRSLLGMAIRVPDHGKLAPWRLITVVGADKQTLGERLAALFARKYPDKPEAKKEKERKRYTWAPTLVVVAARIDTDSRIPAQEQLLSAGCVAYNLLLGAQALGFGAQWLTGWAAYDRDAAGVLGLADDEHVIAFVHIGTAVRDIPERTRPDPDSVIDAWTAA